MNYYFQRKTAEGRPVWEKVYTRLAIQDNSSDEVELLKTPQSGPLIFNPEDFQEGDHIEVTHHPPVKLGDCRPLDELLEQLEQLPVLPFRPGVFYNSYAPGGMLEVIWEDEPHYVDYDSKNRHLAYCRSFDGRRVVGIKVEDIATIKVGAGQWIDS